MRRDINDCDKCKGKNKKQSQNVSDDVMTTLQNVGEISNIQ